MTKDQKARITGAAIFLVSIGFIIWSWHTALTFGYFYDKSAVVFPLMASFGIGLIIFGANKDEGLFKVNNLQDVERVFEENGIELKNREEIKQVIERHGISEIRLPKQNKGLKMISSIWWLILGTGAVASLANYAILSYILNVSSYRILFAIFSMIICASILLYFKLKKSK